MRRCVAALPLRRAALSAAPAIALPASVYPQARFASEGPQSARFSGTPDAGGTEGEGLKAKAKKEVVKMLKMQLILMPIMFLAMLWMYPPVNKQEEKRLREQYERSAGWKT